MGEENEVFEASVEVGLLFQTHDLLKVGVVDVCIHSEQPLEYCPHHIPEIKWEWSTCNETQIINITLLGRQQKNSWKHPRTLYIQNQGCYQQMTQCTKSHQSNWLTSQHGCKTTSTWQVP
jgi:hypothetical protein